MINMKHPPSRKWAWSLGALTLLLFIGVSQVSKPKVKNWVFKPVPRTAVPGAETSDTAAGAYGLPAASSAKTAGGETQAPPEEPGEASSEPFLDEETSVPLPNGPGGSSAAGSTGGAGSAARAGGASQYGAGDTAADSAGKSPAPGAAAAGGKKKDSRSAAAQPGRPGTQAGRAGSPANILKALPADQAGAGGPSLAAMLKGKPGAMLFDPRKIISAGGRAGQGNVSMETNSKVTSENFNPSAKGSEANAGKEPSGPKIPAGKAPALPSSHLRYILQAAQSAGVDPALVAATAARESNFRYGAYRAEPHLKQVTWRASPGARAESYFDGSLGPMQVLRSNFLSRSIGSDSQANDLATNYRVGAQIIRGDLNAFPNDRWKAVAAYNVGVYGAKLGRVPANNYTDTILQWRNEYEKAIAPYR